MVHLYICVKVGETAFSVAKKKLGNDKVCKELQQMESKKQLAVKSISTSQMISVSSVSYHSYTRTPHTINVTTNTQSCITSEIKVRVYIYSLL